MPKDNEYTNEQQEEMFSEDHYRMLVILGLMN
jgi:hypothetical protein